MPQFPAGSRALQSGSRWSAAYTKLKIIGLILLFDQAILLKFNENLNVRLSTSVSRSPISSGLRLAISRDENCSKF